MWARKCLYSSNLVHICCPQKYQKLEANIIFKIYFGCRDRKSTETIVTAQTISCPCRNKILQNGMWQHGLWWHWTYLDDFAFKIMKAPTLVKQGHLFKVNLILNSSSKHLKTLTNAGLKNQCDSTDKRKRNHIEKQERA